MKLLSKVKTFIFLGVLFSTSIAYGVIIDKPSIDLTWPLIFNALIPSGIFGFIGNRYLKRQDKLHDELIEAKNKHAERISNIETIHKARGCDQPIIKGIN